MLHIRVKTEAANLNAVRSKIRGWPQHVARTVYWPQLNRITAEGVALGQEIIRTSYTPTGKSRAARGAGEAGRIDTGNMIKSFTARNRETAGESFSSFVGWIYGKPGYSIFQELGTRNGIVGMNAIGQVQEYMLSEIRKMAKGRFEASPTGELNAGGD